MDELRFSYKPRIIRSLLTILLFGGFSVGLAYQALSNDGALTFFRGSIELSVSQTTMFLWGFAGLFLIMSMLGFYYFFLLFSSKIEIVLTDTHISSPKKSVSKEIVTIKYSDITDINVQKSPGQKILTVISAEDKFIVNSHFLSKKKNIDQIITRLTDKTNIKQ